MNCSNGSRCTFLYEGMRGSEAQAQYIVSDPDVVSGRVLSSIGKAWRSRRGWLKNRTPCR
jgi:hypothetical protein